jgi:hypothetical protein
MRLRALHGFNRGNGEGVAAGALLEDVPEREGVLLVAWGHCVPESEPVARIEHADPVLRNADPVAIRRGRRR